jgi:hypothetical protein
MKLIFSSPSSDDLIRLLKAWRFWLLGAAAGALLGGAIYFIAPPDYRARATVNVDFHLEQAWPQNTDREQFYYLERETRKLEEVAASDEVLGIVNARVGGVTLQQLRAGKLQLSQPDNGGWHFYADDPNPQKAGELASAWAQAFAGKVKADVANPSSGLERYITADPTQVQDLTAQRSLSPSIYILAGAFILLTIGVLADLFVDVRQ